MEGQTRILSAEDEAKLRMFAKGAELRASQGDGFAADEVKLLIGYIRHLECRGRFSCTHIGLDDVERLLPTVLGSCQTKTEVLLGLLRSSSRDRKLSQCKCAARALCYQAMNLVGMCYEVLSIR
jgi:hypothetical protein